MARDALTVQTLTANWGTAPANGAAVTASNGIMVNANDAHKILFLYVPTISGTVTLLAGTNPPAFRAGLGNSAIAIGGTIWSLFTAETAKHVGSGGSILIDFTASMAGSIYAFKLPDTV